MKKIYIILALLTGVFYGCSEEEKGQYPVDDTAPGTIKSPEVQNLPGAAIITYTVPNDEDLLYVKVVYTLDNGTQMEQKASVYENFIKLEGMGRSREQTVQLIAYDRSRNASPPVPVTIHPQDAPIYKILESAKVQASFGGVYLEWNNPLQAEVVISVLTPNAKNKLVIAENFYTKAKSGKGSVKGFPAVETVFAITLRDRWGNLTDTIRGSFLPKPESELDRTKFSRWAPPGNSIPYLFLSGWGMENLWNGNIGGNGYSFPLTAVLPASFTFDMGQTAKLIRFKLHHRSDLNTLYAYGNYKKFQVWGSNHPNVNADFSTWVKIGEYKSVKPSGLPVGQTTEEDFQYAAVAGEEFMVDFAVPPVRYIRFVVEETWGGSVAAQAMELKFFGEIK